MLTRFFSHYSATVAGLLRAQPFDVRTPEGRARERVRRIAWTALSSAIARGVTMITPLVVVPLALNYLGTARYGLWMSATSLVGMLMFADFGLGSGLMTEVSRAHGTRNVIEARRVISTTLILLTALSASLLVVFFGAAPFLPWDWLINAQDPAVAGEARGVLTICAVTFMLNIPLAVVQRVQNGLQQGAQSSAWQMVASIVGMLAILVAVKARASLSGLILLFTSVPPLVSLANALVFFGYNRPDLRFRFGDCDFPTAKRIARNGLAFFLVAAFSSVSLYADNLIIAHTLGLEQVTLFSVPARVASILTSVAMMIYAPLWSANGEALAAGDSSWVARNTRKMRWLTLGVTGGAGLVFVALANRAFHIWIGPEFTAPVTLLIGLSLWAVAISLAGPSFMVLNGAGIVWPQVKLFAAFSCVSVVLKVTLARAYGVSGVVYATVAAYVPLILVPVWLIARRSLVPAPIQERKD